jgi:hypothetical protein
MQISSGCAHYRQTEVTDLGREDSSRFGADNMQNRLGITCQATSGSLSPVSWIQDSGCPTSLLTATQLSAIFPH